MNKKINSLILILCIAILQVSSCKKNDEKPGNNSESNAFKYSANVGPLNYYWCSHDYSTNAANRMGVYFKVYREIWIDGVHVFPVSAGQIEVFLAQDFNGEIYQQKTVQINETYSKVYVPLGFIVPHDMYGGDGIRLELNNHNSSSSLIYNDECYSLYNGVEDVITMGGSGITNPTYFYFYDWRISYN